MRLDLTDGTVFLPEEVKTQLVVRRPPYGAKMQQIAADEKYLAIPMSNSVDVKEGQGPPQSKLWLKRHFRWVRTATIGPIRLSYLRLTNLSDQEMIIQQGMSLE